MIESEREAWLWVHEFLRLYLQEQKFDCIGIHASDGIFTTVAIIKNVRVHSDHTKMNDGIEMRFNGRTSGICGVLGFMRYWCNLISAELYQKMGDRISEHHTELTMHGYLYPCNMQGKAQRLALCRKFAEECA